jgi:hypothetical protein
MDGWMRAGEHTQLGPGLNTCAWNGWPNGKGGRPVRWVVVLRLKAPAGLPVAATLDKDYLYLSQCSTHFANWQACDNPHISRRAGTSGSSPGLQVHEHRSTPPGGSPH